MIRFRCIVPPGSKLTAAAGVCSGLLCLNTIYTLCTMPNYVQYWDYWATLLASLILSIFCFLFLRRRTELILLPAGLLALIACLTPNLLHWMEVGLFFLLLLTLLFRLPRWLFVCFRVLGILCASVGCINVLGTMFQRIATLSAAGRATADFVVPYVVRLLGGDITCLLAMVLLLFAVKCPALPGWMEEDDCYDRIWE